MDILVVGATGATGRLLVRQLLEKEHDVRVIVRSPEKFSEAIRRHPKLHIIQAPILGLRDQDLARHVRGIDAIASCLGHNLSFKGVYGPPRRLVTDAVGRLCDVVKANKPAKAVKMVLMNTAGNRNRDLKEPISGAQRLVVGLIRALLPPHADNEQAADYLRVQIGQQDPYLEWVVVRPDSLTDEKEVSEYEAFASPNRSAIFNAGKTSRINVAHFMAHLIMDLALWRKWQGQMPVLYNKEELGGEE